MDYRTPCLRLAFYISLPDVRLGIEVVQGVARIFTSCISSLDMQGCAEISRRTGTIYEKDVRELDPKSGVAIPK
jgi:hypothetical protein